MILSKLIVHEKSASHDNKAKWTSYAAHLRMSLARNQWMLGDQALVSGMNFFTTALLARMLGVHNFGIFTVLYMVLQYLNSIQNALIVSPMMSLGPQIQDAAKQHAFLRGMAGYQRLFSLLACAGVALYAVMESMNLVHWRMDMSALPPFLLTICCFQVQDWYRRFCYVLDRGCTVFWNDAISYMGQVAVFCFLWRLHGMGVNAAYYGIAATSLLAFAVGYVKDDIGSTWLETKSAIRKSWVAGRSLLLASQSQWLGSQGIFLIVAAIAGVSGASGIRAAITLMGPVVMLYQLLDNVIPVRAARIYAAGGESALRRYLWRTVAMLAAVVGTPIVVATVFAKPVMILVFGKGYGGFAILVMWQGFYLVLGLIVRGLMYYYRTVNNTAVLARSAMIVAIVSVGSCIVLTRRYGAEGGMIALVIGQALNVAILFASSKYFNRRVAEA